MVAGDLMLGAEVIAPVLARDFGKQVLLLLEGQVAFVNAMIPLIYRLSVFTCLAVVEMVVARTGGKVQGQYRVDSGKGQDRTLRGKVPVECAIDGWSRDGEELGEIA